EFCFLALAGPGRVGLYFSFRNALDPLPLVRRLAVDLVQEREPIQSRMPVFGIAGAALSGNAEKAEGHRLTNCWCDGVAVNAVFFKVGIGHAQPIAFIAAVVP